MEGSDAPAVLPHFTDTLRTHALGLLAPTQTQRRRVQTVAHKCIHSQHGQTHSQIHTSYMPTHTLLHTHTHTDVYLSVSCCSSWLIGSNTLTDKWQNIQNTTYNRIGIFFKNHLLSFRNKSRQNLLSICPLWRCEEKRGLYINCCCQSRLSKTSKLHRTVLGHVRKSNIRKFGVKYKKRKEGRQGS